MKHQIIRAHVIPALKSLPDEHVDMLMTSVPYWGLRDYGEDTATIWGGDKSCEHDFSFSEKEHDNLRYRGSASIVSNEQNEEIHKGKKNSGGLFCSKCGAGYGQLGLEPTPELYIEHLRMVFAEVKRVLKKTGTCWVNIGDTYASGKSRYNSGPHTLSGKERNEPTSWNKPDLYKQGYQDKCMCMIPERFAFMMIDLGYILRNKIIWQKPNPMPSSVDDRFNTTYEMLYLFVKNNKSVYWYNDKTGLMVGKKPTSQIEGMDWDWKEVGIVDENSFNVRVRDAKLGRFLIKATEKEKESYGKSKLKKVSHWHSVDYWFDLDTVREPWTDTRPADIKRAEENYLGYLGKYGKGYNAEYRDKIPGQGIKGQPVGNPILGKNPGDIFVINTQPYPEAHFAVFPEKLCEKPILAGCPAEVCRHCGMARVRITKQGNLVPDDPKYTPRGQYHSKEIHPGMTPAGADKPHPNFHYEKETIGWTDCQCEGKDKYEPGIIIDPFAGSGTVGVEGEKLGRSSILIDIKRDYCEMMFKRLKPLVEQTKLSGEQSKIQRTGF